MKVRDRFDKNRIGDLVCDGAYKYVQNFAVEINGERVAEYDSLDGVAEDWEDYKPVEPLIKDKKIREAVRAWAEALNIKECKYSSFWQAFRLGDQSICFCNHRDFGLEDEKFYAIAELCGEEEE